MRMMIDEGTIFPRQGTVIEHDTVVLEREDLEFLHNGVRLRGNGNTHKLPSGTRHTFHFHRRREID